MKLILSILLVLSTLFQLTPAFPTLKLIKAAIPAYKALRRLGLITASSVYHDNEYGHISRYDLPDCYHSTDEKSCNAKSYCEWQTPHTLWFGQEPYHPPPWCGIIIPLRGGAHQEYENEIRMESLQTKPMDIYGYQLIISFILIFLVICAMCLVVNVIIAAGCFGFGNKLLSLSKNQQDDISIV
eukprot:304907_1